MTIQLKPEQKQLIGQAIRAGIIRAVDDVLAAGVEAIRLQLDAQKGSGGRMDANLWSKEFHKWVQGHSRATLLLSEKAVSRDSIYGTRGL